MTIKSIKKNALTLAFCTDKIIQPSLMLKLLDVALTTTDEMEEGNSKYLTCASK